jgi:hypothetical protein
MSGQAIPDFCEGIACFGGRVSVCLKTVIRNLTSTLGYPTSKEGIPSNDVLNSGLALRTTRVPGRILQGCSVVRCPHDQPRHPDMLWGICPSDVGETGVGNGLSTAQWGG